MSRFRLFFWFSILLFAVPEFVYSQQPVGMGTSRLNPQTIDLNKITCRIVPEIKFDTNNRHYLKIKFNVEWFDKSGIPDKDPSNALIIIDNLNAFTKVNKITITDPGQENPYLEQAPPLFTENGKQVEFEPFPNGGVIFNISSMDIVLKIDGAEKNVIRTDLAFNYSVIKGAKKDILLAGKKLSWSFVIQTRSMPGSSCDPAITALNARINTLERKYQSFGIADLLKKTSITQAELDKKQAELELWNISLKKLTDSINADPTLKTCQPQIDGLLKTINNLSLTAQNEENSLIAKTSSAGNKVPANNEIKEPKSTGKTPGITDQPTAPAAKHDAGSGINELQKKYDAILKDIASDFSRLYAEINAGQAGIQSQLNYNAKRIAAVAAMIDKKSQLSSGAEDQMTEELSVCKTMNEANDESNFALLEKVRDFKSSIDNRKSICSSEFLRLDKKSVPPEGKKILASLDEYLNKTSSLEASVDGIRDEIIRQNADITKLIIRIQGDQGLSEMMTHFSDGYETINSRLTTIKNVLNSIETEFEQQKLGKWYLQSVKDNFLARIDALKKDHISILGTYDSLLTSQTESFRKFNFKPVIRAHDDFIKAEAGMDSRIETLRANIADWDAVPFPYVKVVVAGLVLIILAFGLFVYFKALRKKKLLRTIIRPADHAAKKIIKIQNTEFNLSDKGKGLTDVLKSGKNTYMELEMSHEWDDSAVSRVYFERDCIIKTYRFFEDSIHSAGSNSTAYETGGYLIGQWDHDPENHEKFIVSLEDFIEPGDDATFSKYQLNFGAKIGVKLHSTLDNFRQKTGRDVVLTAWFHSHPGLKIFLSDYDLTVQEDFAGSVNKNKMLALVLDPYTPKWDLGIFAYKSDSQMNNASDSKKFFSFDLMYRWALNPQPQPQLQQQEHTESQPAIRSTPPARPLPQLDNYFSFNLQEVLTGSPVKRVFFSTPSIIELKRFIEDAKISQGTEDFVARLEGGIYPHSTALNDVVIDNIIHITDRGKPQAQPSDEAIGIAFCINDLQDDHVEKVKFWLKELTSKSDSSQVLLLVSPDKNSLWLISQGNLDQMNGTIRDQATHIFLSRLIEWTRLRK